MLIFKSPELIEQFHKTDKRLQFVIYAMAGKLWAMCGKDLVVTSVYRDDSATHKDLRGVDVRTKTLTDDESDGLLAFVNDTASTGAKFPRGKPMLVIKDERYERNMSPKATGAHFHVQVANNTATKLLRA